MVAFLRGLLKTAGWRLAICAAAGDGREFDGALAGRGGSDSEGKPAQVVWCRKNRVQAGPSQRDIIPVSAAGVGSLCARAYGSDYAHCVC
jgi:hypothetical protein